MTVRVQQAPFDVAREISAIKGLDPQSDVGALVTFTGTVRATSNGSPLTHMTLEHYAGMTERELQAIEREAHARWPLHATMIIHRFGTLKPGDDIVLVLAASAHRAAAFESASFLMDYLKTRAPFWKQEKTEDGNQHWVKTRQADQSAAAKWK